MESVPFVLRHVDLTADEIAYYLRLNGDLQRQPERFRLIDLFAGAGGLTLGFTHFFNHCFVPVWANDFNRYAANTYNANFDQHCTAADIVDLLADPLFAR